MGKIIAISNQKGGVGKSTTAINLSACLAEKEKTILVVDVDPQGNTTSGLGVDKETVENSVYDVLIGEAKAADVIMETKVPRLSIIPATVDLAGAEIEMLSLSERETRLASQLSSLKRKYDYILIDCPPSLSILTLNALSAADSVLIPIQCEFYALEGLSQMLHTLDLVRERINSKLKIEGVLFTMHDARTNLSSDVMQNVREHLDAPIFETVIPRNVRLAEAPSYGMPINLYDTTSTGAAAYRALAEEILKGSKTNGSKKKWSWKRLGFIDS